ncbi:MAG: succinylglutamate desuccinylase/aspartoacylase family protein [Nannocystaceae bacterium]
MGASTHVDFLAPNIPIYMKRATSPGPTAWIEAGIHGDEIAGVHAVEELLEAGLEPSRGTLFLCPVMNPPAYRAQQRCAPGGLDLNRCFPGDPTGDQREHRLAAALMTAMSDAAPDLLVTLHESKKKFHPEVQPSFGQTIVYGVQPAPAIVDAAVSKMNTTLHHPAETWAPHYFPVSTSSTEVIVERLGCVGLCIETWMGFPLARRVAMHREIVCVLLEEIGVGATFAEVP